MKATNAEMTAVAGSAQFCERCGEKLNPEKTVWLELNQLTQKFVADETVPADESQGFFAFGSACAKAVLKAGGENERIKHNRR